MKLNRKGFTLIELLVTIGIVGLVVGLSTFGIIKILNNSEEQTVVLSEDNIKEAARLYSAEASSNSWNPSDNYDAFCVTIGELMNKGLLDKNAEINVGGDRNTFVMVRRNKNTLVVDKEEILTGDASVCTGEAVNYGEKYTTPEITGSTSYTDKIVINFTSGSASSGIKDYKCLYGDTSSNINKEGIINGNTCTLSNLKNNKPYYVLIYMNSNNGSSIIANGSRDYITSDFNDSSVSQNGTTITIAYNDKDTNENNINNPGHYFKSSFDGTSNKNVEACMLNNNIYTCSGATTSISKGSWYKTADLNISITYTNMGNLDITSRICDGSNNCKEKENSIYIQEEINNNRFVCEGNNRLAVYYVTTCNGSECTYTTKNGLDNTYDFSYDTTGLPTWTINKSSYVDSVKDVSKITSSNGDYTCNRQLVYVKESSVNCRTEASTNKGTETVKKSFGQCTAIYAYRTTMKITEDDTPNWFYSSTHDCYMRGDYLATSKPSGCSSTSGTTCATCTSTCPYGGAAVYISGKYNAYYCELERAQVASKSFAVGDLISRGPECSKYLSEIGKSGFDSNDYSGYFGFCYYKAS